MPHALFGEINFSALLYRQKKKLIFSVLSVEKVPKLSSRLRTRLAAHKNLPYSLKDPDSTSFRFSSFLTLTASDFRMCPQSDDINVGSVVLKREHSDKSVKKL